MLCQLCGVRKARRACPVLNQIICSVCCGTKRLVEISCTPDCGYLTASREYPAAVVRRQQERDIAVLLPTLSELTERQRQLFFVLQSVIARHKPEGFARLSDDDVAEAAGAIAATFETSSRGVLYEHTPESMVAKQLASEMKLLLTEIEKETGRSLQREATSVLRSIETGAREARRSAEGGATAYLTLMGRLLQTGHAGGQAGTPREGVPSQEPGPLIVP